jgi:hypothetical protein
MSGLEEAKKRNCPRRTFAGDRAPGEAGLLHEPFTLAAVMTDQQRRGFLSGG